MPTTEADPHCNEKRKYIGNDYVSIVYNDSGADFNIHTIKVHKLILLFMIEIYKRNDNSSAAWYCEM